MRADAISRSSSNDQNATSAAASSGQLLRPRRGAPVFRKFNPRILARFKPKSCVVRILVNLRWTSFLLSSFFITAAEAAPGDKMELVRDLAGRVGPVIGSALACPDVTRPRIQSVIEKFAAVIRDAASNEAQRSDLAQLFDRSVADGRNLVTTGRTDCRRRNAGWRIWSSHWPHPRPLRLLPLPPHRLSPRRPRLRSASEIRSARSAAYPIAKSASASPRHSPAR